MELASLNKKIAWSNLDCLTTDDLSYEDHYNFYNQRIKFKANSPELLLFLAQSYSCFSQDIRKSNVEFKFIKEGPFSSRFILSTPIDTHFIYKTNNGIATIFQEKINKNTQVAYIGEKPRHKPPLNQVFLLEGNGYDGQLYSIIDFLTTLTITKLMKRLFFFHAASLAWQGRGVILAGETMKGKTTLSLGLAHHGFEFLSDDIACLNPTTQKLIPFPKSLCLREKALPLLPSISLKDGLLTWESPGNRRWLIKAENLGLKVAKETYSPRYIFLLKGFKKQPEIKQAPPREALWYAFSSSYARISDPPRMLFTLSPIFDRMKCYHLWPGKVEETIDLIQELVSE